MNTMQKKLFAFVAAATCVGNVFADTNASNGASPYFSIRSQGENLAREQVGWEEQIHLFDMDCIYGSFYIAPHYSQTFRSDRLAQCIFGDDIDCSNDCGASIKVSGSCVENRGSKDWLADYFGLPTDFESTISFRPRIRNFVVDLGFFLGLDEVAEGLFMKVHLPITHTRWNLRFSESDVKKGTNSYQEGYFSDLAGGNPASALLDNASDFLTGEKAPTIAKTTGAVKFNKLDCCKFPVDCGGCDGKSDKDLTKTRPADVEVILGWNFLLEEDYRLGLGLRVTAPTGNTPDGEFLFEPIVGNGGHWTLGGTLTAQAMFWRSEDEEKSFGAYLDANISHLFDECQSRCFDLCNRPNSRYMLAQKLKATDDATPLSGGGTESTLQFADEFTSVANLTQSNVDVSASVQGDVALKFSYTCSGMSFDLGYNFFGRSCEDLCLKEGCDTTNALDGKTWALKGDAHVYGFTTGTGDLPIPLGAVDNAATIHGGSNRTIGATPCDNANLNNPRITDPQLASSSGDNLDISRSVVLQTNTSIQPVGLQVSDLDLRGTKIISHKIYAHFNYAWMDHEDWTPYLGVGAEVEFSGDSSCCDDKTSSCTTPDSCSASTSCKASCDDCKKCGVNQWGIWLKGGVSFN